MHYKIRAHCPSSPLNPSDLKSKCYKGFMFYPVILFYHLLEREMSSNFLRDGQNES